MSDTDGVASSTDPDPDARPDRWREDDERTHLARAVIRELHDREEYQLARWARHLHYGDGCIGPVEQAVHEDCDDRGYRRRSITQLTDEFVEASDHPESRTVWEDYDDDPMPELRDPDAYDLWTEADERFVHGSMGHDRMQVRAVCLRLWDLGLGPLAATTALHYREDGPPVAENIRSIPTLNEAVRVVADMWLRNPDGYGAAGYANITRTESRDVLEDY